MAGLNTTVGSPVVSLTVGVDRQFSDLPEPVIVNVRIQVEVNKTWYFRLLLLTS